MTDRSILDKHIALINITLRVLEDSFEVFEHNYFMTGFNDDFQYTSWIHEAILEYITPYNDLSETIGLKTLDKGFHHFIIGFNIESGSCYSYDGDEYYEEYYGTVLKHDRPHDMNDVRRILLKHYWEVGYTGIDTDNKYKDTIQQLENSIKRNARRFPKGFTVDDLIEFR